MAADPPNASPARPGTPAQVQPGSPMFIRSLVGEGRLAEALRSVDQMLASTPDDPAWRSARADVLAAWGRGLEASRERQIVWQSGYRDGSMLRSAGWNNLHARQLHESLVAFRSALELDPSDAEARFGCAAVDQAEGRTDQAIATIEVLAEARPDDAALVIALARCELARGDPARAEARLRAWIARTEGPAELLVMLARLLQQSGRGAEAVELYSNAMHVAESDGAPSDAFVELAVLACERADYATASALLVEHLPKQPIETGHRLLAPVLLASGAFDEGWRQLEYRWFVGPQAALRAPYGIPVWRGQALEGRTLLVRAEQGFGDAIQYLRYLPLLKARGARVLFLPIQGLGRIARRFPGIDQVVEDDSAAESADFYVPLMSLPLAMGTTVEDIPPVVPLAPIDADTAARWSKRFPRTDRLRVAVAWAGRPDHPRDHQRSIDLESLAPLIAIPGIEWLSLQKGIAGGQAERVPGHVSWESLGPELDDFDDAAAVLERVDLLISVDTATAHLAGTLGVPTWMFVAEPADCRWLTDRVDTPWYPSMRLFRQAMPGQWGPAIASAAMHLTRMSVSKGAGNASELARLPPATALAAGGKTAAGVSGRTPHLARVIDTRSGWLQYDPDDGRIGAAIERFGEHDEPAMAVLESVIRPGGCWLEVGAHVGLRTLRIAKGVGNTGHVWAFESRGPARTMLRQNLVANGVHNVTVLSARLTTPSAGTGRADDVTVDDLGMPRLDGLVVDLDGAAVSVLRGAESILWRDRPAVFVSVSDAQDANDVAATLRGTGYRAYRLEIPVYSPSNFRRVADAGRIASLAPTVLVAGFPEEREQPRLPNGCVESA